MSRTNQDYSIENVKAMKNTDDDDEYIFREKVENL